MYVYNISVKLKLFMETISIQIVNMLKFETNYIECDGVLNFRNVVWLLISKHKCIIIVDGHHHRLLRIR